MLKQGIEELFCMGFNVQDMRRRSQATHTPSFATTGARNGLTSTEVRNTKNSSAHSIEHEAHAQVQHMGWTVWYVTRTFEDERHLHNYAAYMKRNNG